MNITTARITASLQINNLSLSFGGLKVLQGISMCINPGEITGLIGPNGAGKTSFFNCLTGIYTPQNGSVKFGKVNLSKKTPADRASLGFSRSFQHVVLCPELNMVENVMLGLDRQSKAGWLQAFLPLPGGSSEREANHALALEALQSLGIGDIAKSMPSELPPGVLRLAEIARATVGSPKVLLLDEPAAGLNSVETHDLAEALKKLRADDLILIVVEHDMDLIMDVCDTLHVLNVGQVLATGQPEEIRNNLDVIKVYLGDDDDS